jgi:predicted nucleic acid-binding protein
MSEEDAQDIMDRYIELDLSLTATADLLQRAYEVAVTYKRSVYDAMYVALSVQEQCPLVTADEKLVNAVGADFPNVVLLANWS